MHPCSPNAMHLVQYIEKVGHYDFGRGMKVKVRVTNARHNWGNDEVCIEPIEGSGRIWVRVSSVVF